MSKRLGAALSLLGVLAAAGCASDDWQSKYEEQQKLNLDLSGQNDDLKSQRAQISAQNEQLAQQVKQSDQEAMKLRKDKEDAELRAQELAGSMAKSASMPASSAPSAQVDNKALEAVARDIKAEGGNAIDKVFVTVDGNIEIQLASDVTFGVGKAELSDAGKKSLKSLMPLLSGKFAPYTIRVEGHTDSQPLVKTKAKFSDNFGLGSERSLSVVRFMETELKLDPKRLMSASRGEHNPVADNKSDAGKKQNRRVEIVVVIPREAAVSLAK